MLGRGWLQRLPGATPELTPEDERELLREGLEEEGPVRGTGDTRKWGQAERPDGQGTEEGSEWPGCANGTVPV